MDRTITVREARDAEHEACRRILPQCFFPAAAPELLVAVEDDSIRGAAAVLWCTGGFPLHLHVLEPFRRRGIGRRLVDQVGQASRGETPALRSWFPVAESSPGAAFLERMGFAVERRLHGFETDSLGFVEDAQRLRRRLAHRIPPDARIVSLKEAPAREVAQLVAREFGAAPAFVAAQLQAGADPANCIVAMHGERVAGVMLAALEGDCVRIDVNVVATDYRRGWTNLLLMIAIVERGIAAGARRFRFFCDDDTRDILNVAQRVKARPQERVVLFRKPLE